MSARYRAFISYSHADDALAGWLHRALETYRIPRHLVAKLGLSSNRLHPIFRDREELPSSQNLSQSIRDALADSEHLIVICSPAAARSRWVNEEIVQFRRGNADGRVLCLLAAEADVSFPPAMREGDQEPLAADVRPQADGKDGAKLKLVAGLLGIGLDDLRQRDAQRRQRRLMAIAGGSMIGMALAVGLAAWAFIAQQAAERAEQQATLQARTAQRTLAFLTELLRKSDPTQARGAEIPVREVLERAASRVGEELDDEPLVRANLQRSIGEVFDGLGLYQRAEALFADSFDTYRRELGEHDPETMSALLGLAGARWRLGRYDDAEPALREVLAERQQRLGRAHDETLKAVHALANLLYTRGELEAAEELYREVWQSYRRAHGEDSPLTIGALHNLANVLDTVGREGEALFYRELVLERRRTLQGHDHPDALGAAMALASAYTDAGRLDEAEALAEATFDAMRTVLGADHPNTLAMLGNLAGLDEMRHRMDDAIGRYREQVTGYSRVLGSDHDRTLIARRNLAHAYQLAGQFESAETEFDAAIVGLSGALGADSFMVLDTRAARALLWALQGRNAAAKVEYEAVLPGLERAVGPRDRRVLEALYNLACVTTRLGERDAALDALARAVDGGLRDAAMLVDPDLVPLHGDPRFKALAEHMRDG